MTSPGQRGSERLCAVHLLGFPLATYRRAQEHHDELMREFTLLTLQTGAPSGAPAAPEVPARLLELVRLLSSEYRRVTDAADTQRDEALRRGQVCTDLTYVVPASARAACLQLGAMLDEADDFCREGEQLLTLATPPEALTFRRWYLAEFVAQIDGAPPTPWGERNRNGQLAGTHGP